MIRKIDNNCALCKVLLLLVFIGYYSSLNLFYHAHLINGQVAYHSHPYKKYSQPKTGETKSPAHQHNNDEFYFIQQLDKSVWDDLVVKPDLPEIVILPKKHVVPELPARPVTASTTSICLRAPPAFILFV